MLPPVRRGWWGGGRGPCCRKLCASLRAPACMLPLEKRGAGGSVPGKPAPWNQLFPGGLGRDSNHFVLRGILVSLSHLCFSYESSWWIGFMWWWSLSHSWCLNRSVFPWHLFLGTFAYCPYLQEYYVSADEAGASHVPRKPKIRNPLEMFHGGASEFPNCSQNPSAEDSCCI